jgi:hypothetical protein
LTDALALALVSGVSHHGGDVAFSMEDAPNVTVVVAPDVNAR